MNLKQKSEYNMQFTYNTYTIYFLDEFTDQRIAYAFERCGFNYLHCCTAVHFTGDIQSVRKSRSMVVSCSRISV